MAREELIPVSSLFSWQVNLILPVNEDEKRTTDRASARQARPVRDFLAGGHVGSSNFGVRRGPKAAHGCPAIAHKSQARHRNECDQERVLDQVLSIVFPPKVTQVLGHLCLLRTLEPKSRCWRKEITQKVVLPARECASEYRLKIAGVSFPLLAKASSVLLAQDSTIVFQLVRAVRKSGTKVAGFSLERTARPC